MCLVGSRIRNPVVPWNGIFPLDPECAHTSKSVERHEMPQVSHLLPDSAPLPRPGQAPAVTLSPSLVSPSGRRLRLSPPSFPTLSLPIEVVAAAHRRYGGRRRAATATTRWTLVYNKEQLQQRWRMGLACLVAVPYNGCVGPLSATRNNGNNDGVLPLPRRARPALPLTGSSGYLLPYATMEIGHRFASICCLLLCDILRDW